MPGRNGKHAPPRPRLELRAATASPAEAAAIAAALEQFIADTAPAVAPSEPAQSPWQRAAIEEGVSARQLRSFVWGHAPR